MKELTASGRTVDEAVHSALEQLNITKDQVDIEVIDQGKKGIFGFGAKRAIVKVTQRRNPAEETEAYLKEIVQDMDLDVQVHTAVEGKHVMYELVGDELALLIGKRGQTLNALQYLAQLAINRNSDRYYSVTVDAEGYRTKRRESLEALAIKMAEKAEQLNKKVALEPMPSFERKIVHQILQNRKVTTYSDGAEPHRHIVIKPD
ncbi:RNA-binding cell elongation regulator Jag/EloR [Virgibacillus xinjiangensis]|uniref:RNA-binding protein KhpB n=1 Tax=Virgibacillus xinjiangensis TaxID=393090 RepID=A0ABV7CXI6_9BACI